MSATVQYYRVNATVDFHAAFDAIIKTRANALLVFPDSVTLAHRQPGVFGWREYVEAGASWPMGRIVSRPPSGSPCTSIGS